MEPSPAILNGAGVIPENAMDMPVLGPKVATPDVKTRSGAVAFRDAEFPLPDKTADENVAVRKSAPAPPGRLENSIVPEYVWEMVPPEVVAAAVLVTPKNVSNKTKPGGVGAPSKFVTATGMDIRPPSTLPAVDSVVVPAVSVAVTISLALTWANCSTVPAFVVDPSRSVATHAKAKGSCKARDERARRCARQPIIR